MKKNIIGDLVGRKKQTLAFKPSNTFVDPEASIGVEVEIEGVRQVNPILANSQYWAVKADHSLHDNGAEFVFNQPLFGEDAERAIYEICAAATQNKYKVSRRTGIHVHMDVRDMSNAQLTGLIAYYCLFEPALYRWVGDNREFNNFCVPFYRSTGSLQQAGELLASTFHEQAREGVVLHKAEEYHRYAGLNLKSIATFGSIEFRQLLTSFNPSRIITWINLLLSLKRAAANVQESTRYGILEAVHGQGPVTVADLVFRNLSTTVTNYADFTSDVLRVGFPSAHHFLSIVDAASLGEKDPEQDYDEWEAPRPLDANTHRGYRKWVEKHYPKDEAGYSGSPPQQKQPEDVMVPFNYEQAEARINQFFVNINANGGGGNF